jgi:hypothetical protein
MVPPGNGVVVVLAECADRELHHERIRHRVRSIPGWYKTHLGGRRTYPYDLVTPAHVWLKHTNWRILVKAR